MRMRAAANTNAYADADADTRPEAKTSLNVLVIVHVAFDCGCLTRQKLVFLYPMDITDRFSPKKWGILNFRSENTITRITNVHRTPLTRN